jgi:endonuclease
MRSDYKKWLENEKYSSNTITSQLHRTDRVEACYGDLEVLHENGQLQRVIDELNYSAEDERQSKPNPSKIPFEGNTRNNLSSYKNAVVRYRKFLMGGAENLDENAMPATNINTDTIQTLAAASEAVAQKLSLERDMQAALRRDIKKLGASLFITDDGAERSVDTGLIDITCEDSSSNAIVVVELKAGKADSKAIGQILGYMGDLTQEDEGREIRGILVAHEFDRRVLAAARAVPNLSLMRYSIEFRFEKEK